MPCPFGVVPVERRQRVAAVVELRRSLAAHHREPVERTCRFDSVVGLRHQLDRDAALEVARRGLQAVRPHQCHAAIGIPEAPPRHLVLLAQPDVPTGPVDRRLQIVRGERRKTRAHQAVDQRADIALTLGERQDLGDVLAQQFELPMEEPAKKRGADRARLVPR